ncbi:hypothetical protein [Ignatzschineria indica]|uniref:hypothetical protein n=1 Tax=Ignatzschineria indica TaxID=472583 RepID=UPI0013002D47|nr:hypothetical protein [Ignatzschineria indica]
MLSSIACRQVGDLNHRQILLHSDLYRSDFSALKMPISGHAVVIRVRWFSPAA